MSASRHRIVRIPTLQSFIRSGALATSVALAAAGAAAAAPSDDAVVKGVVDGAAVQYFRDNPHAAAVSIGVLRDGTTYSHGYGTLVRGEQNPPRADTLFALASITKTFTGALLAQAAVEGRVHLSDDVRHYLVGDYPNLEFGGRPIRLFDLLDHRSGLPFFLPDRPEMKPDDKEDPRPFAARVAEVAKTYDRRQFFEDLHKVKLAAAPGENFQYSNAAAQLVGYILERAYGEPYEALLKAKILIPLGMTDTAIRLTDAQRSRLAPGWDEAGRAMLEPDFMPSAGGLKSTLGDMLKYAGWQVKETDPAVRLSHQPVFTATQPVFGDQGTFSVGLNWQMVALAGRRVVWQDGMIEGSSALCIAEPEAKIALVILTNELDPKTGHANQELANAILKGLDPQTTPIPE
jgi:CubicO group peptidase (beta-lactamase class C family)